MTMRSGAAKTQTTIRNYTKIGIIENMEQNESMRRKKVVVKDGRNLDRDFKDAGNEGKAKDDKSKSNARLLELSEERETSEKMSKKEKDRSSDDMNAEGNSTKMCQQKEKDKRNGAVERDTVNQDGEDSQGNEETDKEARGEDVI